MNRQLILFGRVVKAGFYSLFRNLWLSTAATAIMTVTLLIITSTLVINRALEDTIQSFASDLTVSVFLEDDAPQADIDQLESALVSDENVAQVTYISKDEAREAFVLTNEDSDELLQVFDIIEENSLPASFEIELVDLADNSSIVQIFNDEAFADVIESYNEQRLETAKGFGDTQKFINRVGLIAAGIFATISVLVIFNTIRMAIFTRQKEIEIMQLIGATNNYIRGPFIVEASMYGVIAGSISLALILFVVDKANAAELLRQIEFGPVNSLIEQNQLLVGVATIGSGVMIGVLSSLVAMSRYLRLRT